MRYLIDKELYPVEKKKLPVKNILLSLKNFCDFLDYCTYLMMLDIIC